MARVRSRSQPQEDPIPPRGPTLRDKEMLLAFDIDCGYLVEGHRFIARGIGDMGVISWDEGRSAPAFTLEYELVPGVDPADPPFSYLVRICYTADVPLPWVPHDHGAIAPATGGDSTHGSRGGWPLPRSARVLRFTLTGVNSTSGFERDAPDGVLVVDLQDESATWQPRR